MLSLSFDKLRGSGPLIVSPSNHKLRASGFFSSLLFWLGKSLLPLSDGEGDNAPRGSALTLTLSQRARGFQNSDSRMEFW